jgi:glutamate dehydrogenase (NAD(P)+)
VQGMGAMGAGIYRYFSEYGGELAALSDPVFGGTWVFEHPLPDALRHALVHRDVSAAKALLSQVGKKISADVSEVLYQNIDVLFPAATEDAITAGNARLVKARFICEGANNPTSDEAHQILFANKQLVVPDVIANAGGIIAAFVEMTTPSTPEIVRSRAKVQKAKDLTLAKVSENTRQLIDMVARLKVRPDQAGDLMALRNIRDGLSKI